MRATARDREATMTVEQAQHLSAGPDSWQGSVESIHIARSAGEPMESLDDVRAVPGRGLEGDRYSTETGHYSGRPSVGGREVTLIEREVIEHLDGGIITSWGTKLDIELAAGETRRNIMTTGVPLNHLIGREFWVGEVLMRGTRLCEPCNYLEGLTKSGVRMALMHRGGLRTNILNEGVIRIGDTVRVKTS
jgi:MOSC domain-containing protein YiiM